jgi:hypothetical protein
MSSLWAAVRPARALAAVEERPPRPRGFGLEASPGCERTTGSCRGGRRGTVRAIASEVRAAWRRTEACTCGSTRTAREKSSGVSAGRPERSTERGMRMWLPNSRASVSSEYISAPRDSAMPSGTAVRAHASSSSSAMVQTGGTGHKTGGTWAASREPLPIGDATTHSTHTQTHSRSAGRAAMAMAPEFPLTG